MRLDAIDFQNGEENFFVISFFREYSFNDSKLTYSYVERIEIEKLI